MVLEGVFTEGPGETLRFHPMPPPTDEEVGHMLATIATRVRRLLRRRGLDADADVAPPDRLAEESAALAGISSASIQGRIAVGRRARGRVWRLGEEPDAPWVVSNAPRHAQLDGFDLRQCRGTRQGPRAARAGASDSGPAMPPQAASVRRGAEPFPSTRSCVQPNPP